MTKQYYVYVFSDPRPGKGSCERLVGKGHGRRAYDLKNGRPLRFIRFVAQCEKLNLTIPRKIIACASEDAALKLEVKLIAKYGRLDLGKGTLYNLTNGGDGVVGASKAQRAAISIRQRARMADPARRAAMSAIQTTRFTDPKERAKQSRRLTAAYADPVRRAAASARSRARMADPAQRAILSVKAKARFADPAQRAALSIKQTAYYADPKIRAASRAIQLGIKKPAIAESNRRRRGIKMGPMSPERRAAISRALKGRPNLKNRGVKKPWLAERNRLRAAQLRQVNDATVDRT